MLFEAAPESTDTYDTLTNLPTGELGGYLGIDVGDLDITIQLNAIPA